MQTQFCYRRVLQQQVKRSIAVDYAVGVAKGKTSQCRRSFVIDKITQAARCGYFARISSSCLASRLTLNLPFTAAVIEPVSSETTMAIASVFSEMPIAER